jgi:hypothetical protein
MPIFIVWYADPEDDSDWHIARIFDTNTKAHEYVANRDDDFYSITEARVY